MNQGVRVTGFGGGAESVLGVAAALAVASVAVAVRRMSWTSSSDAEPRETLGERLSRFLIAP